MIVEGIDEDFVNIMEYLNNNGFRTFASCDGVLEHHDKPEEVIGAYISFLKSPKIIKLMAEFLKQKDKFSVVINNNTTLEPYYIYGNQIEGMRYGVYFSNEYGELTQEIEKIIMQLNEKEPISEEERKIEKINNTLEKADEQCDLSFNVYLNIEMNRHINMLDIFTKDDGGYYRDMRNLGEKLSNKFETKIKSLKLGEISESEICTYNNIEQFAIIDEKGQSYTMYFRDEKLSEILNYISYIKDIYKQLPILPLIEPDEYYEECETQIPLERTSEKTTNTKVFSKESIKKLTKSRTLSGIKNIYSKLKEKIKKQSKRSENIEKGHTKDE